MTRLAVLTVLLAFLGSSQSEKSTKEQIQLWASGAMHGDEIIGKTGQKWFALFRTETGFELTVTTVTVLDSPSVGELYDKFVRLSQPLETVFLVRGIADLKEGPVKTVFSGHQLVKPNQSISLQLSKDLRFSYQLYAEGKEGKETIDNYRIILYNDEKRQIILSRSPTYLEGAPSLLWAGDLDRDGKLDLLMDMTNHYNAYEPTLFLSSRAAPNKLLKKVASHRMVGC